MVKFTYCHFVEKLKNDKKYHLGKYIPGNRNKMLKSIHCHVVRVFAHGAMGRRIDPSCCEVEE